MPTIPAPFRAYIGLVATAVETAQQLIQRVPELPVEAVGNTMQLSMKVQQRYQELVARGDELLGSLIGAPAQPPAWATFDEDESASPSSADEATNDSAVDVTGFDDDASPSPAFDEAPAFGAVFDDSPTPVSTHGDPLLAETPVMALPVKKPSRPNAGGSRRRVATAPAGPPTGASSDAEADASADASADSGSAFSDATQSAELTSTDMPAPANVDITDAVPMEAVLAELADATPAATSAAVPAARKAPNRRPAARRARQSGGAAADIDAAGGPAQDPAVQQPAEPVDGPALGLSSS